MDGSILTPPAEFASLISLRQREVAGIFIAPALRMLEKKYEKTSEVFLHIRAVIETILDYDEHFDAVDPEKKTIDAAALEASYHTEKAKAEKRNALYWDLVGRYGGDPDTFTGIANDILRLCYLIAQEASPFAHENLIERQHPELLKAVEASSQGKNGDDSLDIRKTIPRSFDEFLITLLQEGHAKDFSGIVKIIMQAGVHLVTTSHPTDYFDQDPINTGTLFRLSMREVARRGPDALKEFMQGQGMAFRQLQIFMGLAPSHEGRGHAPANLNPIAEIGKEIAFRDHAYDRMLDGIFETCDTAFSRILPQYGIAYGEDERVQFMVNVLLSMWTMGDKDGNNNLRSEHLLLANVLVRHWIIKKYRNSLVALVEKEATLDQPLKEWLEDLKTAQDALEKVRLKLISAIADDAIDLPLTRAVFLELNKEVREAMAPLAAKGPGAFEAFLAHKHKEGPEGARKGYLQLLRKLRLFGFTGSLIQLREDAQEHSRIMENLFNALPAGLRGDVPYAHLPRKEKLALLDRLGTHHAEELRAAKATLMARLMAEGRGPETLRRYSKDDPAPITLHGLQRLEIAAANPDQIGVQILAECKGAVQMAETLVLCVASGAKLNVAPLVEERRTLRSLPRIFKEAFGLRMFRDRIWELAEGNPERLINVLLAQFAHSDNMRRMSLMAARSNIYAENWALERAFRKMMPSILALYAADGRISKDEIPTILARMRARDGAFQIQSFQGGSKCDVGRGGVVSTPGITNDLETHRLHMETIQGDDRWQIMRRFERFITTVITNSALAIARRERGIRPANDRNDTIEEALRQVIDRVAPKNYMQHHYRNRNGLGRIMGAIGYKANAVFNNPGARQARASSDTVAACDPSDTGPVDPRDMRTIIFTSTNIDAGIHVGFLASCSIPTAMDELFSGDANLKSQLQTRVTHKYGAGMLAVVDGKLTDQAVQTLFQTSPIFRAAVVNFPMFSAAGSNFWRVLDQWAEKGRRYGSVVSIKITEYLKGKVARDHARTSTNAMRAMGFQLPHGYTSQDAAHNPTMDDCARFAHVLRLATLPHIREQMELGKRMHELGQIIRHDVMGRAGKAGQKTYTVGQARLFRICGALRHIFAHAAYDGAFDPAGGKRRMELNRAPAATP